MRRFSPDIAALPEASPVLPAREIEISLGNMQNSREKVIRPVGLRGLKCRGVALRTIYPNRLKSGAQTPDNGV